MNILDIPDFEKSLRKDVDGYYHCPKCSFEDKEPFWITTHYEIEHE